MNTLGLAGTQAAGIFQVIEDGDMSKRLHPGKSAANGVLSALLAQRGYTGPSRVLEGRYGFPAVFAGEYKSEIMREGLGQKYRIMEVGFKIHAACRYTNTPIDATLMLDLDRFNAKSPKEQDEIIGRRRRDNKEIPDAPASAHVKRTEQESFTPEAFVLRRSMPWTDATRAGFVFVAFGRSLDAFEAQLRRMAGAEDGIADALFTFTRPVTGAYYWCPPVRKGRIDLRAIGV